MIASATVGAQRARIGDVEITYEIVGDGPALVWAHGLASCVDGDRDVVESFASSFTVLAYDARGHGRSTPVRSNDGYSYPLLGGDLIGLLDHIGWDRAVLAGASMGGATCARVAALQPSRAVALVMARPAAHGDDGAAPPWLQALFAGGAHAIRTGGIEGAIAYLLSIPLARAELEANPARIDALRRDWMRHDPLSIAAALDAMPHSSPLIGLTPDRITLPSLIIPGSDLIHPAETGAMIADLIPGAELAPPFDGLPRDREVVELVALVRAFLERTGGRA